MVSLRNIARRWLARVNRVLSFAAPIILTAGLIALALAPCFYLHELLNLRGATRVPGTITELAARQDPDGSITYVPHATFRDPVGNLHQFASRISGDQDAFTPGQHVPILYRAPDAHDAEIATTFRVYTASIILAIAGIILFDLGFFLRFREKRHQTRTAAARAARQARRSSPLDPSPENP